MASQMKWTIARKVGGLAAVLISFILILLIHSIVSLQQIQNDLQEIASVDVPLTEVANEIEITQLEQHITMDELLRKNNRLIEDTSDEKQQIQRLSKKINSLFEEGFNIIKRGLLLEDASDFSAIDLALHQLAERHQEIDHALNRFLEMAVTANNREQVVDQILLLDEEFDVEAIKLIKSIELMTERKTTLAIKHEEMFSLVNYSLGVVGGLLGIMLAAVIVISIRKNIGGISDKIELVNKAINENEAIPQEALQTINSNDELGELSKDLSSLLQSVSTDLSRREQLSKELSDLATKDHLTKCFNRFKWDETKELEIERANRSRQPLSLLFFDIDHFKRINDSCGHSIGDTTLVDVVKVTQSVIRHIDMLYRIGGEEFAILLPETELAQAKVFAERIRTAIENYVFAGVGQVTISLGVTTWLFENDSAEAFVKRADEALYQSKEDGRNRVSASAEFQIGG